jgi:hypothetical protein
MELSMKQESKSYTFSEEAVLDRIQFRAKVDEVVWLVSRESHIVPLKQERLEYLYGEKSMIKRSIYSIHKDGVDRMDSVIEQIKAYESVGLETFEHVVFFIQTSKEYPLVISELSQLQELTTMFSSTADILWGLGVDDTLDDRLFFTLVCSK